MINRLNLCREARILTHRNLKAKERFQELPDLTTE